MNYGNDVSALEIERLNALLALPRERVAGRRVILVNFDLWEIERWKFRLPFRELAFCSTKHMTSTCLAARDRQELIEYPHAALTARPALVTIVEGRGARMVKAGLVFSTWIACVSHATAFAFACCSPGHRNA
jgi:hypothetical protein